jgi:hypothetical protein
MGLRGSQGGSNTGLVVSGGVDLVVLTGCAGLVVMSSGAGRPRPTGTRSDNTGGDEQWWHGSGATELWIRFGAQMTRHSGPTCKWRLQWALLVSDASSSGPNLSAADRMLP